MQIGAAERRRGGIGLVADRLVVGGLVCRGIDRLTEIQIESDLGHGLDRSVQRSHPYLGIKEENRDEVECDKAWETENTQG